MSPPTLVLIRHAQAEHNVEATPQRCDIADPNLTELGRSQCVELQEHLKALVEREGLDVDLIVVSPLKRTVQTALLSLGFLIDKGVPVRANADWQENSDNPCDTGSSLAELTSLFTQVDFSHVDPVFPDKVSPAGQRYASTRAAILARGQAALADLYKHGSTTATTATTTVSSLGGSDTTSTAAPTTASGAAKKKPVVVVVTHSGFLSHSVTGRQYFNADYRVFDFFERDEPEPEPKGTQQSYCLREWAVSKGAGARGISYSDPVELGVNLPA